MAGSTYSSNLKIELMTTGENSGTWGDVTNTNLGTALEQAVIGLGNPDYASDANLTISITNSNASQAARCLVLNVTSVFGSLTATRELVVPTIQKQYIVQNNTTGGQSITVKTSAGTGITVPNGRKAHLYVNGTDVIQMFDFVDINGGTIDGTAIGASSASTGAFTTLNASGATTLDGAVALGNAAGDLITVPGTVNSNLIFTDNTYDIGASGATRPRNLFLAGAATIGGNLSVGGTLTLTGGVNLNGNVTVGDSAADTLTINATITSNLIFTDNTYDIGASGATRPRNLFIAGNITAGGSQTLTGALTVDSTTDSSSTTTGSIQTDGGVGIAKALYVGTTANIAGAVTLSGGTANGVTYLNGSKVLTSGSALTFNGSDFGVSASVATATLASSGAYSSLSFTNSGGAAASGTILTNSSGILQSRAATHAYTNADASSEYMRLTSTGLGIGTSSPSAKLEVYDTTSASATALVQLTGQNNYELNIQSLTTTNSTVGARYNLAVNSSNGEFSWSNSASTLMYLNSDGNLGVGTSGPVSRISATGSSSTTFYALTLRNASGTDGSSAILTFETSSGTQGDAASSAAQIRGIRESSGTNGALAFYTTASGTPAERMRVTSGGNVGIGTSSPTSISGYTVLEVNGNTSGSILDMAQGDAMKGRFVAVSAGFTIETNTGIPIGFSPAGVEAGRFTSGGNFLIGGTSSAAKFAVANNTNDGTYSVRIYGVMGTSTTYLDSDAGNLWGGGLGEFQIQNGTATRPAMLSMGGSVNTDEGMGVINFFRSGNDDSYRSRAQISGVVQSTGTAGRHGGYLSFRTAADGQTDPAERMRIDSSGNVGIGTTSISNRLTVGDPGGVTMRLRDNTSGNFSIIESNSVGSLGFSADHGNTGASSNMNFSVDASERMRIDSSGNVLIGTTTASAKLTVYSPTASALTAALTNLPADNNFQVGFMNGTTGNTPGTSFGKMVGLYSGGEIASISMTRSGGASCQDLRVVVGSGGVYLSNGGTSWASLSDERQKTDLLPIENAVAKVATLRTVTGRYLYDDEDKRRAFLIAQDVLAVLPEAVNTQPDENETLGLQYTDVIPLLAAAIKEQQAIIESLKARLDAANL